MKFLKLTSSIFLSCILLLGCNKSKLTEAESSINQKLLSVCVTPWDQVVAEGAKAIAYTKDFAKCGEDCTPVEFQCTNGKLVSTKINNIEITDPSKAVDISTTKPTCNKETLCSCNLPDGKGVVSNGVQIQTYSAAQVGCGETCDTKKINVLCKNGTFVDPNTQATVSNVNFSCSALACKTCTAPWDATQKVAHQGTITGYINSSLQCGESCLDSAKNSIRFTCNDGNLVRDNGALMNAATSLKTSCQVSTNCSCKTADNMSYSHAPTTALQLWSKPTGSCASPCGASVDYKCVGGSFIKSSDGTTGVAANLYKTCTDQCIYCDLPNGTKLEQGKTAVIHKAETGTCDKMCENITVRCDTNPTRLTKISGTGSGEISEYTSTKSCVDTCVFCNLPDNTKLQEGKTKDLASTVSANCNTTCNFGTVTCDKATASLKLVSGTGVVGNYKYMSCSRNCIQCTLPNGTKLNDGEITINTDQPLYSKETVKCGESCNDAKAYFWCLGGNLRFWGAATGQISDYKYSSCSAEVCKDCTAPWNTSIKVGNNTKGDRFTKSAPACGETCESAKVSYQCSDSVLKIIAGNPATDLAATVTSCSNPVCPTCSFGGRTLNEGDTALAYKNDGSSCAIGVCSDYIKLTCHNGAMTGGDIGIYKHAVCQSSCVQNNKTTEVGRTGDESAEGGGAFPWLCPVIHGRGYAWGGTKLFYYTKPSVACNDSCSKYRVLVECDNLSGIFTNSAQMLYTQCKEACP